MKLLSRVFDSGMGRVSEPYMAMYIAWYMLVVHMIARFNTFGLSSLSRKLSTLNEAVAAEAVSSVKHEWMNITKR